MNTGKLAAYSEIISSIAILVTLVFLTIQMQHNTEALQANQRQSALGGDLHLLGIYIDNPDLVLARVKSELTNKEKIQLFYSLASTLRTRELDWIQYRNGALDDTTWKTYESTLISILSNPNTRAVWQNISPKIFDPGFVTHINELIADRPVTDQLLALQAFD